MFTSRHSTSPGAAVIIQQGWLIFMRSKRIIFYSSSMFRPGGSLEDLDRPRSALGLFGMARMARSSARLSSATDSVNTHSLDQMFFSWPRTVATSEPIQRLLGSSQEPESFSYVCLMCESLIPGDLSKAGNAR